MQSIKKQQKKQDEKAIYYLQLYAEFFSAENRENTQLQYPIQFYI